MFRTLSVIGTARIVASASQAVTLLLLARTLGPVEFGQFAAVLGGLTALSIIADGGATYAVGRHHPTPRSIVEILRAGRLLSVATLLVSVPVVAVVTEQSDTVAVVAGLMLCVWVPLERQAEVAGAYLLARGQDGVVGVAYLLRRVPTLAAVLLVPATVSPVAVFAVMMVATAGAAAVALARRITAETAVPPTSGRIRRLIPQRAVWTLLRPYWVTVAGQGVRQVDVAVLGGVSGAAVAGVFAPASRLVPALLLIPGTFTQLLLARLSVSGERLEARLMVSVVAVSAATFVPLAVLADVWVPLLLGEAYTASAAVVRVVVVSLVLATVSSVFASALHARDGAGRVAVAVWIGATSTIGLIAVWGGQHGAIGAAWAVATGYAVQCVLMGTFQRLPTQRAAPSAARQGTRA